MFSRTSAGDSVTVDQLEGSRPDHLRRARAGGNLSCPAGQEHSYSLPLRQDAAYYQEKGRTLRLQDPHLGMTVTKIANKCAIEQNRLTIHGL